MRLKPNRTGYLLGAALTMWLIACQTVSATPLLLSPSPTHTSVPTRTPTPAATPTPTPSPRPTATSVPPTPFVYGPENLIRGINPLTGLPVEDVSVLNRRPLLIKISNAPPEVRPQSGLSYADMLFEEYVEGGWTRFAAIFYSQGVDHVGSVRSVRLVDFQLAQAYDALLVFSGGSQGVLELLRQEPIYPLNTISPQFGYGEPYFVRFPRAGLDFEHTLFTDTALLWQWANDRNVRKQPYFLESPGMSFSDAPLQGGTPAAHASVTYARTTATWQFDPASGLYLRWTDGIPHVDALTGQQLAFANVVILSAYHEEIDILPEKFFGTEESLYIELVGDGPITLLRDGRAYEGRWQRAAGKSMLTFADINGDVLYLKPGKTFIHIIRAGFESVAILP